MTPEELEQQRLAEQALLAPSLADAEVPEEAGTIDPVELPMEDTGEIAPPSTNHQPKPIKKNQDGSVMFDDGAIAYPGGFVKRSFGKQSLIIDPSGKQHWSKEQIDDPADDLSDKVGAAALEGIPPGEASIIKNMAEYKAAPPSGTAQRTPYWQKVMQRVYQYDPTYDASMYPTRMATRRDYYAGQSSRAIKSLNTVTQHLGSLHDVAQKLGNTDFTPYNGIKNYLATKTGSPEVAEFETTANAAAGELAFAIKGGAPTVDEIKHWREVIDSSSSPQQLDGVIRQAIDLMAGRINAMHDRYQTNMGKPLDFKILDNKSRETLERLGGKHAIDTDDDYAGGSTAAVAPAAPTAPSITQFKEGESRTDPVTQVTRVFRNGKWEKP